MTTQEREEADILAGEYVLGTLAGAERARFEARLAAEPELRAMVDDWTNRLAPLADALPAVEPSPEVWRRIEAALTPHAPDPAARPSLLSRLGFWRWSAIGGALATAVLALFIAFGPKPLGDADHIVVLNDAQGKPAVIVVADVRTNTVAVKQLAAAPPAGRVYQLWLLADAGQPPKPIGIMTLGRGNSACDAGGVEGHAAARVRHRRQSRTARRFADRPSHRPRALSRARHRARALT